MRILFLALGLMAGLTGPGQAANPAPVSGARIIDTEQPFPEFINKLKSAVRANGMGIVAEACATCGTRSIGVTIPGNRVVMIFHPRYAVRMLEASVAAGIEAPLRLYLTERTAGARLTYFLPSHVFAPYGVPALDKMAAELDAIFARIAEQATR